MSISNWAPPYQSSKVALGSLLAHSSRSTNHGMMWLVKFGLMDTKIFTR